MANDAIGFTAREGLMRKLIVNEATEDAFRADMTHDLCPCSVDWL